MPWNDFGKGTPASVILDVHEPARIEQFLRTEDQATADDKGLVLTCAASGRPGKFFYFIFIKLSFLFLHIV